MRSPGDAPDPVRLTNREYCAKFDPRSLIYTLQLGHVDWIDER